MIQTKLSLNFMYCMERFATQIYRTQKPSFKDDAVAKQLMDASENEKSHVQKLQTQIKKLNLNVYPFGFLLKVAVIERTYAHGKNFVGFIRGFNISNGAVASSGVWDMSGIVVVGANESDMAQAVNRIRQMKGGVVVCAGGKILAESPMPVGGVISTQPMETLAKELDSVQQAASDLGFSHSDMRMTLNVLTSPAIAFFRISEDGLFDISQNCFVDLIV